MKRTNPTVRRVTIETAISHTGRRREGRLQVPVLSVTDYITSSNWTPNFLGGRREGQESRKSEKRQKKEE